MVKQRTGLGRPWGPWENDRRLAGGRREAMMSEKEKQKAARERSSAAPNLGVPRGHVAAAKPAAIKVRSRHGPDIGVGRDADL